MRLRAALVAQEHFRPLVAHEEGGGRTELRRQRSEDPSFADREPANTRARELENDRRAAVLLHTADDLVQPAPQELERDVARADERTQTPAEEDLHAYGHAHGHRALSQRLGERRRGDDEREHADAADAREPGLVGHAEPRRTGEALQMHRRREAHPRPRHQHAVAEHLPGSERGCAVVARATVAT